ncbi:MAG: hypothetical protein ACK59A_10130 [Cyanobacteriota bacterium]|jgi:hypothetical protein
MGNNLCLVRATGCGCLIYRETTGCYVVSHRGVPQQAVRVATLPGAYALCRGWDRQPSTLGVGA